MANLSFCVPCFNHASGNRILTVLPSPTPCGLGLDIDLPWADEPSPGNLRFSTGKISTCLFVTYADILTSVSSTAAHAATSHYHRTLPYHPAPANRDRIHSFGTRLRPVYFRRQNARPVSCYALFKGWLLLSQPPGCLSVLTSFNSLSLDLGTLADDLGCFPFEHEAYPSHSHSRAITQRHSELARIWNPFRDPSPNCTLPPLR